jgi:hypothetical protein
VRIAVLGWGSLTWQPANDHGELAAIGAWESDGPALPIEFARISTDDRLTLIIVPGYATLSKALWIRSPFDDIDEAVANLARRETDTHPDNIHSFGGSRRSDADPQVSAAVEAWLSGQADLDAAIWTGLGPGRRWGAGGWGIEQARRHLAALEGVPRERAIEYITRTPPQIDTPVRRALADLL